MDKERGRSLGNALLAEDEGFDNDYEEEFSGNSVKKNIDENYKDISLNSYNNLRNLIKKYKNGEQDIVVTISHLEKIFGSKDKALEYLLELVEKY